jgi:hypothetical protein
LAYCGAWRRRVVGGRVAVVEVASLMGLLGCREVVARRLELAASQSRQIRYLD